MSTLFVAAVVLEHPDNREKALTAEYELAESITAASSAISRRLQVNGWEVSQIHIKEADDLKATETLAYRTKRWTGPVREESDEYLRMGTAADYLNVARVTFLDLIAETEWQPDAMTPTGNYLYTKASLDEMEKKALKMRGLEKQ